MNLTGTRENEPFVFASNGFKHYRQAFHNIFFAQTNKTLFFIKISFSILYADIVGFTGKFQPFQ